MSSITDVHNVHKIDAPGPGIRIPRRRATDKTGYRHIKTQHIQIDIPADAPPDELIELANKLLRLAERKAA